MDLFPLQYESLVLFVRQFGNKDCLLSALEGRAHLAQGNYQKARASFLHAASAVGSEHEDLLWMLLGVPGQHGLAAYYTRIMQLFDAEISPRFNSAAETEKPGLYAKVRLFFSF
jgi:hypothetical protein